MRHLLHRTVQKHKRRGENEVHINDVYLVNETKYEFLGIYFGYYCSIPRDDIDHAMADSRAS